MITIDGLLNLVDSEKYQKKFISTVQLSKNVNYPVHTVHNGLIVIGALNTDDTNRVNRRFQLRMDGHRGKD